MSAIFRSLYANTVTAGTKVAFGASTIQFNCGHFVAQKSDSLPNTGKVFVSFGATGSGGGIVIYPGATEPFRAQPAGAIVNASQLYVDSEVSGDGVLFFYSLADWRSFNSIEAKLEDALRRYALTIGATLDDCSFTTGISDAERTADNVNIYCQSCEEAVIHTGNWNCHVTVQVRTAVGKADDNNRLERHRLRTAYVRDLIVDPDAEKILAAIAPDLTVYDKSIREMRCEQRVEGRQWVSELTFTITVSGSVLT